MVVEQKVIILMATYNGSNYIRRQLDSLLSQSYQHWELIIRDDQSNDDTVRIIEEYERTSSKIYLLKTKSDYHGACANFAALFNWAVKNKEFDYLMFCDQDDIWTPFKVESSLSQLADMDKRYPKGSNLIYGNLNIINEYDEETGGIIQVFKPTKSTIISQNPMFGCTMILNKEMVKLVGNIPSDAENHDYWVALVNVFLGNNEMYTDKRILYRQHAQNVTSQGISFNKLIKRYAGGKQVKELKIKLAMLRYFCEQYKSELKEVDFKLIINFVDSFNRGNPFHVLRTLIKNKIYRNTKLQNLAFWITIIFRYSKLKN